MKINPIFFRCSLALVFGAMLGCEPASLDPKPSGMGGAGEPPPDKAIGTSCLVNSECFSGYCIDGYCCNEICSGTCNVCNAPGSEGTCSDFAPGACSACGGTLGFSGPPLINVQGRGLAIGDLNDDGILDMAAEFPLANVYASRIRVVFGYGDGTFSAPTPLDVPFSFFEPFLGRAHIANLNGDFMPDLVGAGTLFLNRGQGVFWNSPPLDGLNDIVIAEDLNGDGLSDLVSLNSVYDKDAGETYQSIIIAMNGGQATFSEAIEYFSGTEKKDALAVDVNCDGFLDLVVSDMKQPKISVLFNQCDGTFSLQEEYDVPIEGVEMTTSDVNNDGWPDLILNSGYDQHIAIMLNQGQGVFGPLTKYPISCPDIRSVVAADFNGDGWNDLITANHATEAIGVLMNQSDGTFAPEVTYTTMAAPTLLKAADVNRDGKMDLVISYNWNAEILYNQGAGTFASKQEIVSGTNYTDVVATDLNGDGQSDLVITRNAFKVTDIEIFINQGQGTFVPAGVYPTDGYTLMSVADLNGDTYPDILVNTNATTLASNILLNQGDGTFVGGGTLPFGPRTFGIATGDIDGDGLVDILATNWEENALSIFSNQGGGTFAPPIQMQIGAGPRFIKLGDLNNDGMLDIAIANQNELTVTLLLNLGNGTFAPKIDYPYESTPWAIEMADLDGNQTADLLVVNYEGGRLTVSLSQGDGTFAPRAEYTVNSGEHRHYALKAADVNQDGAMDVVLAGGLSNTIEVLLNQGDGTGRLREKLLYGAGVYPAAIAISDFDGNGTPDFAVGHDSIPLYEGAENRPQSGVYLMLNQCLP